ncbi:MAG: cytochrome b/b6 domain-containing protein [Pseudobdellovibrionaceae bacterium]
MERKLVYDLPTRLFHWIFGGLFLIAFAIAKTVDDDSSWFNLHSLVGLTLGFVVLLRIVWGIFGTQHARFSGFALNPMNLITYFTGIMSGEKKRWAGHNPASSWAGLVMMSLALCLAFTGYLMTSGPDKETFEDIHEILANSFMIVVVLHILGILLHTFRYKEMIGLSMIDGKKAEVPPSQTINSSKPFFGYLFVSLVLAFGMYLYKNYDLQKGALQFFGSSLQLGEPESNTAERDDSD